MRSSLVLRAVFRWFLFGFGLFNICTNASAAEPPENVSALIYSSSAVELFWTPTDSTVVEIKRNGELLVERDARSLFQEGLSSENDYVYELRSVGNDGTKSLPVTINLTTRGFEPPVKRVFAGSTNTGPESLATEPTTEPTSEQVTEQGTERAAEPASEAQIAAAPVESGTQQGEPNSDSGDAAATAALQNIVQTGNNCIATDSASLINCIVNRGSRNQIDIAADIHCANNCCPGGAALLNINGGSNIEIDGNGYTLSRSAGHRQCGLLDIQQASNITVRNLILDDNRDIAGCQVEDKCPRMVHVRHSNNIEFSHTHVRHGKGYAFYVQGTNGFSFEHGSLHNSGVLGMYIGHANDASTNVRVQHSTFTDNQTNALALLGVVGQNPEDNIIANNVFLRNHRKGQWAVAPRFGSGFTGGGQVYIAQASNVTVRDNRVADGYCSNCFVQNRNRSGVSGIELGKPNEKSLSSVHVLGNSIVNHDGFGVSQNSNSVLDGTIKVNDNVLLNSTSGEHISGAVKTGNRVQNTQQFFSFESASSFASQFDTDYGCATGSIVERQCGIDSQFGNCAVALTMGSADCSSAMVALSGPTQSVHQGKRVAASGWVREPMGQWCLQFRDGSGNLIQEHCEPLEKQGASLESDVQNYVGLPLLDAVSPGGSHSVQIVVRHQQSQSTMLLDDLKLSIGD